MLVQEIDLAATRQFPPLVLDYLSGTEKLAHLYNAFPAPGHYEQIIKRRTYSQENRQVLVSTLDEQYRSLGLLSSPADDAVRQSLELLKKENTYTVCTGHQLNVFTGPLYTIYKIASCISLARHLQELYPEQHIVPLFWLASEDHDFAEISSIHLFGKDISWSYPATVEHMPVGRLGTEGISNLIGELRQMNLDQQLLDIFEQAYSKGSLAEASIHLYHQLFRQYGLLVLNPDHRALKQLFQPLMKRELIERSNAGLVSESISWLEQEKYKVQVNPRPINFFFISDSGSRERITWKDGFFEILNTDLRYTEAELLKILEETPERFSPNVVMRPLYQEYILPNLAYIGGPGEIAYWLELKRMFEANQVQFPILHLRDSFLLAGEKLYKYVSESGLTLEDFFLSGEELTKTYLDKSTQGQNINGELFAINDFFDQILGKVENVDKSAIGSWVKEINNEKSTLKKWEKKFNDLLKQKSEQQLNKIIKTRSNLLPDGALAERSENILARSGADVFGFIELIIQHSSPFTFKLACLKI